MNQRPQQQTPQQRLGYLGRLIEILRKDGLHVLWIKFLGECCYRRLFVVERRLDASLPEPTCELPLEFALLEAEELDVFYAFHHTETRETLLQRLQQGDNCYVARHNGRLVSSCWVSEGKHTSETWIRYLRYALALSTDEIYTYDHYTAEDCRGRRISPAIKLWVMRLYRQRGYQRMTAAVSPENRASLRALAKSGFHVTRRIGYLRLGPKLWHFSKRFNDSSKP